MNSNILSLIENPKQIRGVSANILTGACGAYFFNSLFDSHPEILPFSVHATTQEPENYYYYYMNRFPDKYKDVDFYTSVIDSWNIPSTYAQYYNISNRANVMREAMRDAFANLGDDFSFFHLYYIQYIGLAALCNYPLETKTPIIFQHRHIYYPHFYKEGYANLSTDFYIKYIRLIRHPEMSLDRIYNNTKAKMSLLPGTVACNYSYPFLLYYQDDLYKYLSRDKLFTIRFEDLHLNSEEILKACCNHLGIKYMPEILLKSTVKGEPYVVYLPDGKPLDGFSMEKGQELTPRHLSKFHKLLIRYFFEKFYLRYGYKASRSRLFRYFDVFLPAYAIFLALPSLRELKIILSFYAFCFTFKKGLMKDIFCYTNFRLLTTGNMKQFSANIFSALYSSSNFPRIYSLVNIFSLRKMQAFSFLALHKSKKEKFLLYFVKPLFFFLFFGPFLHFFYNKFRTLIFLISYRFTSDEKLPPLINELDGSIGSVGKHVTRAA